MDSFQQSGHEFWTWLRNEKDVFLSEKIALHDYRAENQGRGLIAKENIGNDELLFTIPENTILSPQSSLLKDKVAELSDLDEWMSLILIMLYENQIPNSRWKSYLDVLPTAFDTPMFWNEEELKELQGTEVPSRIGKAKSEEEYSTILLPVIKANSELFDLEKCGLDTFHQMGSLVLAYSFGRSGNTHDDDDDKIDEEEKNDIAMVPLADMLNANPQLNNARLFEAGGGWEMRSIRAIPEGQQIYNTYGNLPNSDLLRRYGYVIPDSRDDIVEIPFEMIVETVSTLTKEEVERRIALLEEEGVFEEAFEILHSGKIPEEMSVFCLAMMATTLDEESIPQMKKTAELKKALTDVLGVRLAKYEPSIEQDDELLKTDLPIRKRMAIEVRLGEKSIIKKALDRVDAWDVPPPAKRIKT